MALSSQLAMLNTQRPAGEPAKQSKLARRWSIGSKVGIPLDDERQWEGAVD